MEHRGKCSDPGIEVLGSWVQLYHWLSQDPGELWNPPGTQFLHISTGAMKPALLSCRPVILVPTLPQESWELDGTAPVTLAPSWYSTMS